MDLEKLRLARSLYYQCLGELFIFSFSKERLSKLQEYLKTMQKYLFDENLKSNFDILLKHLEDKNSIQAFFKEYDLLFLSLKNSIPTTFSYFENSNPLLCVRMALKQQNSEKEKELYGQNRIAESKVLVCAAMCSIKVLLVGESLKIEEIYRNRLMNRNYGIPNLSKVWNGKLLI